MSYHGETVEKNLDLCVCEREREREREREIYRKHISHNFHWEPTASGKFTDSLLRASETFPKCFPKVSITFYKGLP